MITPNKTGFKAGQTAVASRVGGKNFNLATFNINAALAKAGLNVSNILAQQDKQAEGGM